MALEAGFLGTPFIRFNDFIGKIGCSDELENKYQLGFGIQTNEINELFRRVNWLISRENLKKEWELKRRNLFSSTIDLSEFLIWFFEDYPQSVKKLKENSNYQWKFKWQNIG